jgi:hypothetical protein
MRSFIVVLTLLVPVMVSGQPALIQPSHVYFPCAASIDDPCTGDDRIDVGSGSYGYNSNGGIDMYADSYYDTGDGDCGSNFVARSGWSSDLLVVVGQVYLSDLDGGTNLFKTKLTVTRHAQSGCTDAPIQTFADTATEVPGEGNWAQCYGDGRANCSGSYSDPINCHLPDVLLTRPGAGSAWYKTWVEYYECASDGSNCSLEDQDTGCFRIDWT